MTDTLTTPASPSFEKLKAKLAELFELDKADLDFGIYRVLRQRHAEISEFLDKHLVKAVNEALASHATDGQAQLKQDLEDAIKAVKLLKQDPDQNPTVQELKEKLKEGGDLDALADEVYSHLLTFFSRYYQEGDFLGLQRSTVHGREKYMIPYNGEEVKLVWANMDQYYIKTSDLLRDYTFHIYSNPEGFFKGDPGETRTVHFLLVEGDTEKDNRLADTKTTRAFSLDETTLFELTSSDELQIRFRYRDHKSERNLQDKLNVETVKTLADNLPEPWRSILFAADTTYQGKEKKDTRNILQKHLRSYTARHQFDYFIHKDLGGFLRRELDFYLKNEVMHLDDIEEDTAPKAEEYLSKLRAIRRCAMPVIRMLTQLEEFQKKLWLKKKFVVETRYCMTLDRVPEELYPEVCANAAQWEEWEQLYTLSETPETTTKAKPGTVAFLKAQPFMVLDTRHFEPAFTLKLLASVDNLDEALDGVCFHSENFQALKLMQDRFQSQISCIYIDPPYNANSSEIAYKNSYKHSSWISLMYDRLMLPQALCAEKFTLIVAIDEVEQEVLGRILSDLYPGFEKSCITVVHNATGQQGNNFSYTHEFAYFVFPSEGNHLGLEDRADNPDVRPLRNVSKGAHLRTDAANCFFPIYVRDGKIIGFGDVSHDDFHPTGINVVRDDGVIEVYPIDPQGVERKWVFARNTVETILSELNPEFDARKQHWDIIRTKSKFNFKTVWQHSKYSANSYGSRILNEMLPGNVFTFPKSINTVRDCIHAGIGGRKSGLILDFFAGSGTTAHAVINLNGEDNGKRKYILAEMGDYFESVLVPRIKKRIFSEGWSDGKPQNRQLGVSHAFKILRLESYEDTLNNLHIRQSDAQKAVLQRATEAQQDEYALGYFLEVETAGSPSMLDVTQFRDPFSYKLQIATRSAGETKPTNVDLVETFNWLLGLKVKHVDHLKGFLTVTGERRAGGRVLVIWRTLGDDVAADNKALEGFLEKITVNPADTEFDALYINGSHTLSDPHNKIHLIEEVFQRRMFETKSFESLAQ